MVCHEQSILGDFESDGFFKFFFLHQGFMHDIVYTDSSGVDNSRRLLPELDYATPVWFCGCQMQCRKFCDGMAYGIVDRTLRYFSSANVSYGYAHYSGRGCHGKHFVAVAEYDYQIGA